MNWQIKSIAINWPVFNNFTYQYFLTDFLYAIATQSYNIKICLIPIPEGCTCSTCRLLQGKWYWLMKFISLDVYAIEMGNVNY